jgi:hypothetical protein
MTALLGPAFCAGHSYFSFRVCCTFWHHRAPSPFKIENLHQSDNDVMGTFYVRQYRTHAHGIGHCLLAASACTKSILQGSKNNSTIQWCPPPPTPCSMIAQADKVTWGLVKGKPAVSGSESLSTPYEPCLDERNSHDCVYLSIQVTAGVQNLVQLNQKTRSSREPKNRAALHSDQ